ncbi:MAG: hypothetical protein IKG93_06710 [Clostridiales bacterium]|nr:hypothetical protein [Clostridiales bacterium]
MKSFHKPVAVVLAYMVATALFGCACTRKDIEITTVPTTRATTAAAPQETTTEPSEASESTSEETSESTVQSEELKSSERPEQVYSRLSKETITELETSDSYGEIYAFSNRKELGCSGFFDRSGRIIVDPVFTPISYLADGGYVVCGKEGKVGYLSHDGAIYTGLKYDDFCIDRITGELLFLKKTETGFLCYTIDMETGKQDVERGIEVDCESLGTNVTLDNIRLESMYREYAEFYLETSNKYFLVDGLTGKNVAFPSENAVWQGSFFLCRTNDDKYQFFNINGEELLQEKEYTLVDSNIDYYLCAGKDGIDLYNANLKLVASMASPDKKVEEIYFRHDYVFLFLEDSIELYDLNLSKVNSIPKELDGFYYPSVSMIVQNATETEISMAPVLEYHGKENTTLINLKSENKIELNGYCLAFVSETNLIVEEAGRKWKLMRASDFEVLMEGEGDYYINADRANGNLYLVSSEGEKKETESGARQGTSKAIDLYSMKDEKLVLDDFTEAGCDDLRLMDIRDGYFYFRPVSQGETGTLLSDNSGNIVFRYYPDPASDD